MTSAILWLRRDLRLDDNPALQAAARRAALIPVYIHAPEEEAPWMPGAASAVWFRHSIEALSAALAGHGLTLLLRRGPTFEALLRLVEETGAAEVHWNRLYDPATIARDAQVKQGLVARGVAVHSHNAALLAEPWSIETGAGSPYRVFTPFWRKLRAQIERTPAPAPPPAQLTGPASMPSSLRLDDILPRPHPRWDHGFWQHWRPGEDGANRALEAFVEGAVRGYREQRDLPDRAGTSRLSPHLHFGEISPRRILARLHVERWPASIEPDVEGYRRELGWREFAHHLLYHFPASAGSDFDPRFGAFPWAPQDDAVIDAWRRGCTGVPFVDAGMRELRQTGWMHNRVRMVVASFLSKNLRQHWLHGARWFWDNLLDADLANNTQGWQWSAGTGADAAPYFRIFNPVSQAQRFDPLGRYVRRWVPELADLPDRALFAPWQYADLRHRVAPGYPATPIVDLGRSREAALDAYQRMRQAR